MPSTRPELDDDNNNFDLDEEGLFRIGSESPPPLPSTPPALVPVKRPHPHPVLPASSVVAPIPTSTLQNPRGHQAGRIGKAMIVMMMMMNVYSETT